MKKFIVIIGMFVFVGVLSAQTNTSFCDPELQNQVGKISNMGGTYLKEFLVSPDDLKIDSKTSKLCFQASMLLSDGVTYRFYVKSSTKIPCETILTLTQGDILSHEPLISIHQKYNEAVAFRDIKIEKTGLYSFTVSFRDNAKGCALVLLSFISQESNARTKSVVDTSKVYTLVDEPAKFRGGDINNFRNYVAENFILDTASMHGVVGKIIIQFVVNNSGRVQNVEVLRSCGNPKLDKEGARVVKSSPFWSPAKIQGVFVKEQMIIPIIIN
jgi:TonB family protein